MIDLTRSFRTWCLIIVLSYLSIFYSLGSFWVIIFHWSCRNTLSSSYNPNNLECHVTTKKINQNPKKIKILTTFYFDYYFFHLIRFLCVLFFLFKIPFHLDYIIWTLYMDFQIIQSKILDCPDFLNNNDIYY